MYSNNEKNENCIKVGEMEGLDSQHPDTENVTLQESLVNQSTLGVTCTLRTKAPTRGPRCVMGMARGEDDSTRTQLCCSLEVSLESTVHHPQGNVPESQGAAVRGSSWIPLCQGSAKEANPDHHCSAPRVKGAHSGSGAGQQ